MIRLDESSSGQEHRDLLEEQSSVMTSSTVDNGHRRAGGWGVTFCRGAIKLQVVLNVFSFIK